MPVFLNGVLVTPTTKPIPKPTSGRRSYNEDIKTLVPVIEDARKNGNYGIRAIVDYLNAKGVTAPSGRRWSYTTLHTALERLEALGATEGPRSISAAASARPSRPRLGRAASRRALIAAAKQIIREHPEV
jgi:hypothetical protein